MKMRGRGEVKRDGKQYVYIGRQPRLIAVIECKQHEYDWREATIFGSCGLKLTGLEAEICTT